MTSNESKTSVLMDFQIFYHYITNSILCKFVQLIFSDHQGKILQDVAMAPIKDRCSLSSAIPLFRVLPFPRNLHNCSQVRIVYLY